MGAAVGLGVRGGAHLALHHLHPVPHSGLEEEPLAVHTHTQTHSGMNSNNIWTIELYETNPFSRSVEHCFHMCDRMVIYFFIAASYAPW